MSIFNLGNNVRQPFLSVTRHHQKPSVPQDKKDVQNDAGVLKKEFALSYSLNTNLPIVNGPNWGNKTTLPKQSKVTKVNKVVTNKSNDKMERIKMRVSSRNGRRHPWHASNIHRKHKIVYPIEKEER